MTVYVDDMRMKATVPNGVSSVSGRWSHLFADTVAELEIFARELGLKPDWRQNSKGFIHYDIVETRRVKAVALGAKEVSWRELPTYLRTIELVR